MHSMLSLQMEICVVDTETELAEGGDKTEIGALRRQEGPVPALRSKTKLYH